MKKDEVIRIAREAGLLPNPEVYVEDLERFAELISATERERIKAANEPVIEHINRYLSETTAVITALRAALAQQDAPVQEPVVVHPVSQAVLCKLS